MLELDLSELVRLSWLKRQHPQLCVWLYQPPTPCGHKSTVTCTLLRLIQPCCLRCALAAALVRVLSNVLRFVLLLDLVPTSKSLVVALSYAAASLCSTTETMYRQLNSGPAIYCLQTRGGGDGGGGWGNDGENTEDSKGDMMALGAAHVRKRSSATESMPGGLYLGSPLARHPSRETCFWSKKGRKDFSCLGYVCSFL